MSEVCYYLKDKESEEKTPIYLQFKYNGQRLKYYFGQAIDPNFWNESKQRVKSNKTTTSDGQHSLNDLLDNMEDVLLAAYRKEEQMASHEVLKKHLNDFLHQNIAD